jgi:hypothetical protein
MMPKSMIITCEGITKSYPLGKLLALFEKTKFLGSAKILNERLRGTIGEFATALYVYAWLAARGKHLSAQRVIASLIDGRWLMLEYKKTGKCPDDIFFDLRFVDVRIDNKTTRHLNGNISVNHLVDDHLYIGGISTDKMLSELKFEFMGACWGRDLEKAYPTDPRLQMVYRPKQRWIPMSEILASFSWE